jgi:protein SCO1/2
VLILISLVAAGCREPAGLHRVAMPVGEFTLVGDDGNEFRLSSLRGRPVLLFFGYTHCPDACPTMMSKVAISYRLAGEKATVVPTLFVSVDPRDTPPLLKQYVSYYGAVPARGLTGTKAQIDAVVRQFGASYEIRDTGSAAGPMVDHTIRLYLIDGEGNVAAFFDSIAAPETIAKELKAKL